jgi:hypothetical protein
MTDAQPDPCQYPYDVLARDRLTYSLLRWPLAENESSAVDWMPLWMVLLVVAAMTSQLLPLALDRNDDPWPLNTNTVQLQHPSREKKVAYITTGSCQIIHNITALVINTL